MPIFEYRCQACGHAFDILQKAAEGALRKCPECGKLKLKKLVSAPSFHLKGTGWYKTDFRDKGKDTGKDNGKAGKDGKDGDDKPAKGHTLDSGPAHSHDHDHSHGSGGHTHSHGGKTHTHGPGAHKH